jgi:hypothetical protein
MAKRGVQKKEGEKLDGASLDNVIDLLERKDSPITKKEACALLNIAYNTTRLGRVLEGYKEEKVRHARIRDKKRGTPATGMELSGIIEDYIQGKPMSEIALSNFRSPAFVKGVLERNNVPMRASSANYFHPELLPDEALSETFGPGEIVWSAKYNTTAEIIGHNSTDPKFKKWNNNGMVQNHPIHGNCYRIWLYGNHSRFAVQPWYELGKLSHLNELGVKISG